MRSGSSNEQQTQVEPIKQQEPSPVTSAKQAEAPAQSITDMISSNKAYAVAAAAVIGMTALFAGGMQPCLTMLLKASRAASTTVFTTRTCQTPSCSKEVKSKVSSHVSLQMSIICITFTVVLAAGSQPTLASSTKVAEFQASGFLFKDSVEVTALEDPESKLTALRFLLQAGLPHSRLYLAPSGVQAVLGCPAQTAVLPCHYLRLLCIFLRGQEVPWLQEGSLTLVDPSRSLLMQSRVSPCSSLTSRGALWTSWPKTSSQSLHR
jgi:hypothetical protein